MPEKVPFGGKKEKPAGTAPAAAQGVDADGVSHGRTCLCPKCLRGLKTFWLCRKCAPDCRRYADLGGVAQHIRMKHPAEACAALAVQHAVSEAGALGAGRAPAPLRVAYDDDDLCVLVKPAGVETARFKHDDAMCVLTVPPARRADGLSHPQFVHRLDAPTSGCLVFAKTASALRILSANFAAREVHKRYRAIVAGAVQGERGDVELPLSGKESKTSWRLLSRHASAAHGEVCLLELTPHTGRNHQLRRHLSTLGVGAGHPVCADPCQALRRQRLAADPLSRCGSDHR